MSMQAVCYAETEPSRRGAASKGRVAARRGFTLVEIIVVVIIIAILATIIGTRVVGRVGASKSSVAASNAAAVASAVKLYMADWGALPSSIDALAARPTSAGGKGPYVDNAEQLMDPWGKRYALIVPGKKNFDFDIVSYGADGTAGGEGENADVVKP
jgi:general secretion pathway protein G